MTVAIAPPFIHVEDSNGNPYVSAKLYVYQVNTTTLAAIYSDTALSVSITNPMTSDASGNFARAYLAAGTYKLRAETSAAVLIWQYDYIDTGLGNSGTLPIASGGTAAITAAAARTSLGAAAQTDVDNLSTDITTLSASLQSITSVPQGRLTLTTATPVLASGVTAGTSVYYTPYIGNQVPIWNGTLFVLKTFAELTLTLSASHTANSIYDVFIWLEGSTVTIGTGPGWNTATAGAGARGTGAGTTELERKNGLWTNKSTSALTMRNGATTYSVATNLATYVGSISMDGTNGQCSCLIAYGQSRKWGVWNAYNRVPIAMVAGDTTATWAYATATFRAPNGTAANSVTSFIGLPEELTFARYYAEAALASSSSTPTAVVGIGYNSTTTSSGSQSSNSNGVTSTTFTAGIVAEYAAAPSIGINVINGLEKGTASNTVTWQGNELGNAIRVTYRG